MCIGGMFIGVCDWIDVIMDIVEVEDFYVYVDVVWVGFVMICEE